MAALQAQFDAALLPGHESPSPVVLRSGSPIGEEYRESFWRLRDHARALVERVEKDLQRTGEAQLVISEDNSAPSSEWLNQEWMRARDSRRQADHEGLAERVFDRVLDEAVELNDDDIRFLGATALAANAPTWEAVAAIRLLASLAEEDAFGPRDVLEQPLVDALELNDPARRLAAVEGLWQCDATATLPALEALAQVERVASIKSTLDHAVHVLRGLAGEGS